MPTAKVSKKGWIVIPKEIRRRLNIKPGDEVQIFDYGQSIRILPAGDDPIKRMRGMFKDGPSLTEGLLEDRREERDHEERKMKRWMKKD